MAVPVMRIVTRLNIGGPARQALSLTKDLKPRFDPILVAGEVGPSEGEMRDPAVPVLRVPLVRPIRPALDVRAYLSIRELLAEHRSRIVHTHMAKAGTVGRLAGMRTREGVRLVHTFHGHVLSGYFSSPVQTAFVRAERFLARHTHALVAVSEEIRDELLDLGVGSPDRWHVIPVGIDLSPFSAGNRTQARLALGIAARRKVVAIVGRLIPIKDHELLLRALVSLPDVDLLIVGDGEMRAKLQDLASGLGLAPRVRFLGWTDDVAAVYAAADVVALTSRKEGTPVSLIEALASSRAVVATDVGGVKSVVQDGVTGTLVPPGDVAALTRALGEILDNPRRRRSMGQRGPRSVARFSSDRLAQDVSDLYEELLTKADR